MCDGAGVSVLVCMRGAALEVGLVFLWMFRVDW